MTESDSWDGPSPDEKTRKANIAQIQQEKKLQKSFLIEIYGPFLGKNYSLDEEIIFIGRDASCSIQIDLDNVSRQHCRLVKKEENIFIEDLESTNGTYLNDVAVSREQLHHGDFIKIGSVVFKFVSGGNIEGLYHEEIYKMTITDGLTQVANKRYLLDFLDREIARAIRFGRPLSVAMLDIDHFKLINDEYGHLAGDCILKELCSLLGKLVRKEELLARYGGEEFVIVLPESGLTSASTIAEKARRMIEQHAFTFADQSIKVTISLGAAELSPMAADPLNLLRTCDEKLYEAKNNGRNCVVG